VCPWVWLTSLSILPSKFVYVMCVTQSSSSIRLCVHLSTCRCLNWVYLLATMNHAAVNICVCHFITKLILFLSVDFKK
jgi:hypothetical protein